MNVTPLSEPLDRPHGEPHWARKLVGTVVILIVAWLLVTQVIFTGGNSDRSAQVRAAAGASACTQTDYQIINRLDGAKTTVYDCGFPNGRDRCVTLENGITRDATAEVRLLLTDTLGASKPACLG